MDLTKRVSKIRYLGKLSLLLCFCFVGVLFIKPDVTKAAVTAGGDLTPRTQEREDSDADVDTEPEDLSWTEDHAIDQSSFTEDTIHVKGNIVVYGWQSDDHDYVALIKNKIPKDEDGNSKPIFEVESGYTLTLENIELDGDNKVAEKTPCVLLDEGAHLVIKGKTSIHDVAANAKNGSAGVYVSNSGTVTMKTGSIYNCENFGIYADGNGVNGNGTDITMVDGKIFNCSVGLGAWKRSSITMKGGEICDSSILTKGFSISSKNDSDNCVNCGSSGWGGHGIMIGSSSKLDLTGGKIHDNAGSGINALGGVINISDGVVISDNTYGLNVTSTAVCNINGGEIKNNSADGIYAIASCDINIADITLSNNKNNGISAGANCTVDFSHGTISGSGAGIMLQDGSLNWTGGTIVESTNSDGINSYSVYNHGRECFIGTNARCKVKDSDVQNENSPYVYLDCDDGTDRYVTTDGNRKFTIGSNNNADGKVLVTATAETAQGVCDGLYYLTPEATYGKTVSDNQVVVGKLETDTNTANYNPGNPPALGNKQVLITVKQMKHNMNTGKYVLASTTINQNHANDEVKDISYYVGQLKPHKETRYRTVCEYKIDSKYTTYGNTIGASEISGDSDFVEPSLPEPDDLAGESTNPPEHEDFFDKDEHIDPHTVSKPPLSRASGFVDSNGNIHDSYADGYDGANMYKIPMGANGRNGSISATYDEEKSKAAGKDVFSTKIDGEDRTVSKHCYTKSYTVTVWYCDPFTPNTVDIEGYTYKTGAQTRTRISSNTTIEVRYEPNAYTMTEQHKKHVLYDNSYMNLNEKTHDMITDVKCDGLQYKIDRTKNASNKPCYYDTIYKPIHQKNPAGWGWHDGGSKWIKGSKSLDGTNGDEIRHADGSWTVTGNETFDVYYEPNQYTVSFKENKPNKRDYDGTFTSEPTDSIPSLTADTLVVTFTADYPGLPSATMTGYLFDGWFTNNKINAENNDYMECCDDKAHSLANTDTTAYIDTKCSKVTATTGSHDNHSTVYNLISDCTLYAHWTPITYKLIFDDNSPYHVSDASDLTTNADSQSDYNKPTVPNNPKMPTPTLTYDWPYILPKNCYDRTTLTHMMYNGGDNIIKHSNFLGWGIQHDYPDVDYVSNLQKVVYNDEGSVVNLTTTNNGDYTLYAIWDDCPDFLFTEFPDRYFTLEDAQNGMITESELLSQVVAYDRESHPLQAKTSEEVAATGSDVGITLYDYKASDFTSLTDTASMTVTYQLKDDYGHIGYMTIVVRISYNDIERHMYGTDYVRDITDYYSKQTKENGGFSDNSLWTTDDSYKNELQKAFQSDSPYYSHTFSSDDLANIRDYVDKNGFGNAQDPTALKDLYNQYK